MSHKVSALFLSLCLIVSLAACSQPAVEGALSTLENGPSASQAELVETPVPTQAPTQKPTATPNPTFTPEPEPSEEEYKALCSSSYDYKTLARDPAAFIGTFVMFRGEVIQVMEATGITVLRVNVTQNQYGWWEDTIFVNYFPSEDEPRILEDDIVSIYGEMMDLKTYETIMGGSVTIPQVYAKYIDIE